MLATVSKTIKVVPAFSASANNRTIQLYHHKGKISNSNVTILFAPGFMSTGQGTKSIHLAEFSQSKGYDYVCYDPECIGELYEKPAVCKIKSSINVACVIHVL